MRNIGEMIAQLREEKGLSQKELARGIVSTAELSRIENNTKTAGIFVLAALLERLGKSIDRLEYITDSNEYQEICLQELIYQRLMQCDLEETEELLAEYEDCADDEQPLGVQFVLQIKAIIGYLKNKDSEVCFLQLIKALEITYGNWKQEELQEVCLCTQEIQLLILISYFAFLEKKLSIENMEKLIFYIDKHYEDMKERGKIYPQALWLAGKVYLAENKLKRAQELFAQSKAVMAESGTITLMRKVLEDEIEGGKENEEQKKAIDFLYEKVGRKQVEEECLCLLIKSSCRDIVISNELLRELRESKQLSQEEISEEICAQETLSRIEKKRRAPSKKTVTKLLKKLDYDRDFYQGYIVTNDYRLLEMVGEINALLYRKETDTAYRLLNELEAQLDMSIPTNRQYIGEKRLQKKLNDGECKLEHAIEELKYLLYETMSEVEKLIYRSPSREEFAILIHLAICFKEMQEKERARTLYQQMWEYYNRSDVLARDHIISKALFYINYVALLEETNDLLKAEIIGWEGIGFLLDCERGDVAGTLLANISCIYEKMPVKGEPQLAQQCLWNSYTLLKMFCHQKDAEKVENYIKNIYGENI